MEDQEDQTAFMEMVQQFDREQRKETIVRIEVPATAKMYSETNRSQNYGYKFIEAVYDCLHIDQFIEDYLKQKKSREKHPAGEIVKFPVFNKFLKDLSSQHNFLKPSKNDPLTQKIRCIRVVFVRKTVKVGSCVGYAGPTYPCYNLTFTV